MINLGDERELREYLTGRGLVREGEAVSTRQLSGGVSCEVVKVVTQTGAFVVKQALPKLRVKEDWFSDVSRILNEKDCLAVYNRLVPGQAPRLLFADEKHYLFGMEAAPDGAEMWKTHLLRGDLDFGIGRTVAGALARVHNATAGDEAVRERFRDPTFYIQLRIDPYFRTIAQRHPALRPAIAAEIDQILATRLALVHGDYSPKNILVAPDRLYILDFEVAHFGDPAFDLGFLTNHLLLKAVKHKDWAPAYLNLMTDVAGTYLHAVEFTDPRELEAHTVRTLALLFLARVDGKSPAEYITDDADKDLIRSLAYAILHEKPQNYREAAALAAERIEAARGRNQAAGRER